MAMSSDMRKLAQDLLDEHNTRLEAVADLRSDVRQELADFRAAHQAITAEQRHRLNEHMENLRSQIAEVGRANTELLSDLNAAQRKMTIEQQQRLSEGMDNLRRSVAETSQATATFLKEAGSAHQAMTAAQQQWLDEQVVSLRRQVYALRQAATSFMENLDANHQSMAAGLQDQLTIQVNEMRSNVAAMRDGFRVELQAVKTDQREAGQVWRELKMHKAQGRARSAPVQSTTTETVKAEAPASEQPHPTTEV